MNEVEKILAVFARCSNSTSDLLYFPVDGVGKIVHAALSMNREIEKLFDETERLQKRIEGLSSKG